MVGLGITIGRCPALHTRRGAAAITDTNTQHMPDTTRHLLPRTEHMAFQFKPAQRTQVFLKILLKGPTGSGKTYGALHIADGLAPGSIAGIDSEHERMLFYADKIPFQHGILDDFHPKHYIAAINAAVDGGFKVVVCDSLTHCWQNVLDRKDRYDKANPKSNQWSNWAIFGAEWDELMRTILEAPIHVICTARSKMAHEQVEEGGRKKIVKLGLAPQLRENSEFEFSLCFDVETTTDNRHPAQVSKDNTGLFGEPGKVWDLTDGTVPALLRQWMSSAKPPERPTPATQQAIDDMLLLLPEAQQSRARKRVADRKQRGFPEDEALEVLAQLRLLVHGAVAPAAPAVAAAPPPPPVPHPPVDDAPPLTDDAHETSDDRAPLPSMSLSEAASMTVTLSDGAKALGDLSTKSLKKLRPLAVERENLALVQAIDVVLADHAALASPAAPPAVTASRGVAPDLGDPSLTIAGKMQVTTEAGSYQLQQLPRRYLERCLQHRTDLTHEMRAGIRVVLAYRDGNPMDPHVMEVESKDAPDEVQHVSTAGT